MAVTADVIVIGLGAMGSATADELAGRGMRVVGLEARAPGHHDGSSHGATRIVRRVIEEAPFYVPLAADAIDRWDALDADTGEHLFVRTGVIRAAPPESDLLALFRASADAHGLPYESLGTAEVAERFPALTVPEGFTALFEADAGIVHAARAVATLQERARRRGAVLRFEEPVVAWSAAGGRVLVETPLDRYEADRLVITAGAWTGRLVPELGLPLVAHRVVNVSFEPIERSRHEPARLPAFLLEDEGGNDLPGTAALRGGVYGVPAVAGEGVKVGSSGTPTDPDHVDRQVHDAEVARLRAWLDRFLPGASGPVTSTLTCLYTKTPDEHFVIDHHPAHAEVVVSSPCSGHGFKYTPALGAVLADLATGAQPAHVLDPFRIDRFAQPSSSTASQTGSTPEK